MIRRIVMAAALTLAGTAVAVLPAGPAQARACSMGHTCVTTWWTGPDLSVVSGGMIEGCDGTFERWGVRTAYADWTETPC